MSSKLFVKSTFLSFWCELLSLLPFLEEDNFAKLWWFSGDRRTVKRSMQRSRVNGNWSVPTLLSSFLAKRGTLAEQLPLIFVSNKLKSSCQERKSEKIGLDGAQRLVPWVYVCDSLIGEDCKDSSSLIPRHSLLINKLFSSRPWKTPLKSKY